MAGLIFPTRKLSKALTVKIETAKQKALEKELIREAVARDKEQRRFQETTMKRQLELRMKEAAKRKAFLRKSIGNL